MGGEDRDIHFDTMQMGQGATMALPIWAYYMKKIYRDPTLDYSPYSTFDLPIGYDPCAKEDETVGEENGIDEVYE